MSVRVSTAPWRVTAPVRLTTLLLLAVGLMLASLPALGLLGAILVVLFWLERGAPAVVAWLQALRQLKWLFIALAVLYLGFTPGEPVWSGWDRPSWQGVTEGGHRALVLAVLLLAVHWLVRPLPSEELAAGFIWLATPLARVGIGTERFAVRLALTLQNVAELQARVAALRDQARRGWVDAAAELVREIEAAPEHQEHRWIEIRTPGWREWGLPLSLGALIVGLAALL